MIECVPEIATSCESGARSAGLKHTRVERKGSE